MLVLSVPSPSNMSLYQPTPFLGGDLAPILIHINSYSPSPLPPPRAIFVTSVFPYVHERGKPSYKLDKQTTIM